MCVHLLPINSNRPAAMGCSSSRDARRDIEMASTVRRHSHARSTSSLGSSLGLCRGQHDGVFADSPLPLPLEEMVKGGAAGSPGEEATAWSAEGPRHASWELVTRRLLGGKRGLLEVLPDAASATSSTANWPASATSSTAEWSVSPSGCAGETSSLPSVLSVSDFDPAVLAGFLPRQTLVGPSPSHPALLFPEQEAQAPMEATEDPFVDMRMPVFRLDIPEVAGLVRSRVDEFHEKMKAKKKLKEQSGESSDAVADEVAAPPRRFPAVVYFTSLRGVRRTFEDGRAVRSILRCYRVRVDERDVSMHAGFKDELRDLLGAGLPLALPRVFVPCDGDTAVDLGSADDVRALHEAGELATALAVCEPLAAKAYLAPPCAGCGDMRFIPCETCYGSCKIFAGDEYIHLDDMFERCPDCNENGLIRCPACCY